MHVIDCIIFGIFMLICLILGIKSSGKIKTLEQFALGYKGITSTALICSLLSSAIGSGITMGAAEKAYLFGLVFVICQLFTPLAWYIVSLIIPPAIEKLKGCITISDVMSRYYGDSGRYLVAILALSSSLLAMIVQALAMGHLFHYFFGIKPIYGMLAGYGVLTSYSMLGGIKAVIVTEVFKFIVFFVVIPASYAFASIKSGGFPHLMENLPDSFKFLEFNKENILQIIALIFYSVFPRYDAPLIQRCLMVPDKKKLTASFRNITVLYVPFSISFCAIAYVVKGYMPDMDAKEIVFYYIEFFLPIGMQGLMVAGLFAIIMSFAEAQLSSSSIILTHDVVKQFYPNISHKGQLILIRLFIFILGFSSLAVVSNFTTSHLLNIAWAAFNFYDPLISIPLTAAFLGFKSNEKSFISNAFFALLFLLIGRLYAGEFAIVSFCFAIFGSAIGFFGMHYYQLYIGHNFTQSTGIILGKPKKLSWIKDLISQLNSQPSNIKYKEFVVFTLSAYFICSLYLCFFNYHQTLLFLLISGYFMCLILLARDVVFKPNFMKRYLKSYWNIVVIYCLPFLSSYMLLINDGDDFWVINGIFASISLYFFVNAVKYIVFHLIGMLLAFMVFFILENEHYSALSAFGSVGYVVAFIIVTSLMFLRNREKEEETKLENMHLFGGAMAHEVRSPLATLNMGAMQLESVVNDMKTMVKSSNLDSSNIQTLSELSEIISKVTKKGINTVEVLLTSLRNNSTSNDKGIYKIKDIINLAISEYINHHNLATLLKLRLDSNFNIHGSEHYLKHVILNLLSNAHKYGGRNVLISISTKGNKVFIRDNGIGILEDDLPHIFEKFYTSGSQSGTGIGLAFCKMVMEDMGGSIECFSEYGKYTEFVLTFPDRD